VLGWLVFALSVSVYVYLSVAIQHQPFHIGPRYLRFFDLRVYRGAVMRLLHGFSIYKRPIVLHLGFTYPPFAALLFTPLALVSFGLGRVLVTATNVVALVYLLRRALAITRPQCAGSRLIGSRPADAWALAALAAAAALWLEPISVALGYGQVDLLVAALVVFDISRPDNARGKGVGIGLAAAIKLTPLLFIAYLLLSSRRRAALAGVLTFIATIAISFMLVPGDASRYWGTLVFQSSRVGNAVDAGNQSLSGAVGRLLAEPHLGSVAMFAVAVVAPVGLLLAARASRRGDEAVGFSLCAITTLLASPVSWTHHWTLAVPALLLLALTAYERRSRWLAVCAGGAAAVGYSYLPELTMPGRRHRLHHHGLILRAHEPALTGWASLARDPYVLVGLLALAGAAAASLRRDDVKLPWRGMPQDVAGRVEHSADNHGARVPAAAQSG
jgi:alpha-1,2-mannosyltransferase